MFQFGLIADRKRISAPGRSGNSKRRRRSSGVVLRPPSGQGPRDAVSCSDEHEQRAHPVHGRHFDTDDQRADRNADHERAQWVDHAGPADGREHQRGTDLLIGGHPTGGLPRSQVGSARSCPSVPL